MWADDDVCHGVQSFVGTEVFVPMQRYDEVSLQYAFRPMPAANTGLSKVRSLSATNLRSAEWLSHLRCVNIRWVEVAWRRARTRAGVEGGCYLRHGGRHVTPTRR
jgi:hypothetical protein